MKMIRRITSGIAILALSAATHTNAADNSGPYIGVSAGLAQTSIDDSGFKEKDVAYKAFGGYSISDLIAFEVAYIDGGKPTQELTVGTAELALSGYNASVLLRARTASSFALFAKVGYAMYDYTLTAVAAGVATDIADESDSGMSYGLGVTYTIARKYLVRAEFEGIKVKDGTFNMVTIGGGYRF